MNKKIFTKRLRHLCLLCLMLLLGSGNVWGETVTLGPWSSKPISGSNATTVTGSLQDANKNSWNVTLTGSESSKNPSQSVNSTNKYWQLGQNGNMVTATFATSAITGKISKIEINCAAYNGKGAASVTVGGNAFGGSSQVMPTWSNSNGDVLTFSGSANGEIVVTLAATTGGRAIYLNSITVTYESGTNTAASPTLTTGATFTTSTYDVTITNNESGATVYYTTDGSDPTTSTETSFTGASKTIQISATTTVKAMAVLTGKDNSSIASATYTYEKSIANTQETAYTIAKAKEIIDGGSSQLTTTSVYVTGYVSQIDSYSEKYGSLTYWISDSKGTSADFEVYGGLNIDGTKFAATTDLVVGDSVTIYGFIKKYGTTYEFNSNNVLKFRKTSATQKTPTITATYKTLLTYPGSADVYTIETNSDGALTVLSSNTSVAGAEYSGNTVTITPFSVGTTTITISFDATETYYAAEKTYTLTVTEPFDPSKYNALVAEKDGKFYAATNTLVDSKYFNATQVYAVNNKVINLETPTNYAWKITYIEDEDSATVQTPNNQYLVVTTSTTASLSNTENKLLVKDGGFYGDPKDEETAARGFAFNYNDGKSRMACYMVSSTYPLAKPMTFTDGYTRIVTKGNWGTICLPNAVEVADMYGAKFYSISGMTGTKTNPISLILTEETGALVAGRPYFFKATADTLVVAYTGEATKASGDYNGLFGCIPGGMTLTTGYILKNNTLLKVDNTFTCGANRAYVSFTSVPTTSAKGDVEIAVDGATGIESLSPTSTSSANNEEVYNLQGQKVGAGYKGVVIKNGKKLWIK